MEDRLSDELADLGPGSCEGLVGDRLFDDLTDLGPGSCEGLMGDRCVAVDGWWVGLMLVGVLHYLKSPSRAVKVVLELFRE